MKLKNGVNRNEIFFLAYHTTIINILHSFLRAQWLGISGFIKLLPTFITNENWTSVSLHPIHNLNANITGDGLVGSAELVQVRDLGDSVPSCTHPNQPNHVPSYRN